MKHPSTRALYDHWNERRGYRAAPDRADIEPGAIRRVLADTFILAFDANAGHPFRVAGTRVCAAFGRELKGDAFIDMWDIDSQRLVRDLVAVVAHESVGAVAGARGRNSEGELEFELLILPLRHRARTDARILGALAPVELPAWFGVRTLDRLTLGTLRYLGPEPVARPPLRLVPTQPAGRMRHGFVVYDGGQA
jgi:hypothetical protein